MSSARISNNSGPRILVVRLGAMGDIIHTLPAVASLKHSFPGCRLTWLVEAPWAPLLDRNPYVDRITIVRRENPGAWMRTCRELRREHFDFAVDFQGLLKSAFAATMARPDRIYGFRRSRETPAALFYSNRAATRAVHKVEQNLELAAAAGAVGILRTFPVPEGVPEGELPETPFVLASPLAGWRSKQWPMPFYSQLAERLRKDLGLKLVLNGPPGFLSRDGEGADVLSGPIPHFSGLPGLIHATRRAAAVIGLDSGPLHLAAALEKPGVAIYGPTDPAINGPYGETITVLRSPRAVTSYKRSSGIDPSMREIDPGQVFHALVAQLARRPAGCAAE